MVECCFTSRETVGLLGTGAQDGHLGFHTAPELAFSHYPATVGYIVVPDTCCVTPGVSVARLDLVKYALHIEKQIKKRKKSGTQNFLNANQALVVLLVPVC